MMSGSTLKILAVLSMAIDHAAFFMLDGDTVFYGAMRCVGRVAFPVFAFLITEGFLHTRNRMRYFLLLTGFGMVSEVPWYLLNGADGTHNVMFTLAFGVLALAAIEALREHRALGCCAVLLTAWCAEWSGVDYGWRGVLMITLFYLLGCKGRQPYPSCRMLQLLFTFPLMSHYGVAGALLACGAIMLYDGTRGFIHGKAAKYAFYAFYPAHLLAIRFFL